MLMERIAIIDHSNHRLYVEDIDDETLANYGGSEEAYINANYSLEMYSWDYITDAEYFPAGLDKDPIDIDFESWI